MTFSAEDLAGVCGYMNADGMRQNLTEIVKWSTKDESIQDAEMTGFDELGFDARVVRGSGAESVRVAWPQPANDRGEVRGQIMALYERAVFG